METAAAPGAAELIIATLLAIAVVVVPITWKKVNPFLSPMLGSVVLVAIAGVDAQAGVGSFSKGVGDTFGKVGILVALGAIVGWPLVETSRSSAWSWCC